MARKKESIWEQAWVVRDGCIKYNPFCQNYDVANALRDDGGWDEPDPWCAPYEWEDYHSARTGCGTPAVSGHVPVVLTLAMELLNQEYCEITTEPHPVKLPEPSKPESVKLPKPPKPKPKPVKKVPRPAWLAEATAEYQKTKARLATERKAAQELKKQRAWKFNWKELTPSTKHAPEIDEGRRLLFAVYHKDILLTYIYRRYTHPYDRNKACWYVYHDLENTLMQNGCTFIGCLSLNPRVLYGVLNNVSIVKTTVEQHIRENHKLPK